MKHFHDIGPMSKGLAYSTSKMGDKLKSDEIKKNTYISLNSWRKLSHKEAFCRQIYLQAQLQPAQNMK